MTPEQYNLLKELSQKMDFVMEWIKNKETQQISFPLDLASQRAIGAPSFEGAGSTTLTQSYSVVGGGGGTVTAPRHFVQSVVLIINGVRYEFPSLI